ncbi:MAG: glycosyltransferase, partial [Spirulinaceae cyanobacterium]
MTFQSHIQAQFDPSTTQLAVLVSNEFEGLTRNGGIGTYFTTLSYQLAANGWRVILLLTQTHKSYRGVSPWSQIAQVFSTREAAQVLRLSAQQQALLKTAQASELGRSFERESRRVLYFVEAFSAVYPQAQLYVECPEIWGFGYHTIAAKHSGRLNSKVLVAVMTHGSFEWLAEINQQHCLIDFKDAQWQWLAQHYEQWCCDHADLTFSPSLFLIDKMAQCGWQTEQIKHLPYFLPLLAPSPPESAIPISGERRPVVFFGRLEERKGLRLFVAALQGLSETLRTSIEILFFGKVGGVSSRGGLEMSSWDYVERELSGVVRYQLHSDLFSQEAIAAIASLPNPIVCLTSRAENFPYAALEMGQLPVHLVVADTGGFRETLGLLERTDGVHWFRADSIAALRDTLITSISNLDPPTLPSRDRLLEVNQTLLHQRLDLMSEAQSQTAIPPADQPSVAVLIVSEANSTKLKTTLSQLASQTHTASEVWVATSAEAIATLEEKFPQCHYFPLPLYQTLGETYNQLVSKTTADYLLCLSPGLSLQPHCIKTLIKATRAGEAEIVVSPLMVLYADKIHHILTIESSLLQLLQQDYPYDLPILIRRSWLTQFPYDETRGLAAINWSSFAAAIATQRSIVYYPYPLLAIATDAPIIPPPQWPKERFHLRQ